MDSGEVVISSVVDKPGLPGSERALPVADFLEWLGNLDEAQEFYVEARNPDQELTCWSLGGRDELAVVQRLDGEGGSLIRCGDGSIPSGGEAEIRVMDILVPFTGEFLMTVRHARTVFEELLATGRFPDRVPEEDWVRL